MSGNVRRNTRRVLLALAAVCLAGAAVAPSVGAATDSTDTIPRPEVFNGNAAAQGVSVQLDRDALLPVPDLFKFIGLDGQSTYEATTRQARASLLFPGNGVILGPGLACGTFGASFPAEFKPILDTCLRYQYPLTAFADDFQPDASTVAPLQLGTPNSDISGNAIVASAHAGEDAATTNAIIQDLSVLGLPPFGPLLVPVPNLTLDGSVVKIASAAAKTNQRIVKGVLVSVSTVTLSGVSLVGGLVNIGNIVSTSTITDDGHGKQTANATLQLSGATVAGVPAQITNKGITLGPAPNTPLGLSQLDQANKVLQTFGIKLTALPTTEHANKGDSASASVGGVLVEFARDQRGLPLLPSPTDPGKQQIDPNGRYVGTVQLAATGVKGTAASFGLDEVVGGVDNAVGDFSGGTLGSDSSLGFDNSALGSDLLGGGGGADQSNGGSVGRNGTSTPTRPSLVASTANNFGGRLGFLYLALMFGVLALCIAPRLVIPARFGRTQ